ncbi:MAG: hypothetical protein ACPHLK_00070 [Gammaproteobacteria bacterium]|jgi:hypothetical protein
MKKSILLLFTLLYANQASADAIDMKDFLILKNNVSEAEVLFKLGPPDHETINDDCFNHVLNKTWFYIPKRKSSNKWISEFRFNGNGRLISKDRYKVR